MELQWSPGVWERKCNAYLFIGFTLSTRFSNAICESGLSNVLSLEGVAVAVEDAYNLNHVSYWLISKKLSIVFVYVPFLQHQRLSLLHKEIGNNCKWSWSVQHLYNYYKFLLMWIKKRWWLVKKMKLLEEWKGKESFDLRFQVEVEACSRV